LPWCIDKHSTYNKIILCFVYTPVHPEQAAWSVVIIVNWFSGLHFCWRTIYMRLYGKKSHKLLYKLPTQPFITADNVKSSWLRTIGENVMHLLIHHPIYPKWQSGEQDPLCHHLEAGSNAVLLIIVLEICYFNSLQHYSRGALALYS